MRNPASTPYPVDFCKRLLGKMTDIRPVVSIKMELNWRQTRRLRKVSHLPTSWQSQRLLDRKSAFNLW